MARRSTVFAWSMAAGAVIAAPCQGVDSPHLQQVSQHVWRVAAARGEPTPANGGATTQLVVVRDGERVWLLGSGPTPAFGAALACAVESTLSQRVTDVVNARAAPELAMGNLAFEGARLHALPDVIAMMRSRCEECRARLQSRIGAAGESLRPDSVRTPLLAVGAPGDTEGRLGPFDWIAVERRAGERVLVLRHRGDAAVIAQGLVWADDVPDLRETDSALLRAGLQRVLGFAAGALVLGEQGEPGTAATVAVNVRYLDILRDELATRVKRGDERAAMGLSVDLPGFASQPGYAHRHPLNVQRVYRELETDLLR